MLHLLKFPTMRERLHILQAKFLLRPQSLPANALPKCLLPYVTQATSKSLWSQLSQSNTIWRRHSPFRDRKALQQAIKAYRQENLDAIRSAPNSKLVRQCHPNISLDPNL
ncbi:hypothetical protein BDF20DRAFT_982579 [Mycotypha africana]|uniref:uncharacterized protein n=1 Tax=Mycotypha africana TaxID=64632 RepID=UPI002301B929|nr:uncharacterized protein BDF20DRAFT_982579 [Mycotypha africana]KAI8967557.1 hypothetical protein BDF20DRAFT_982579 [Mycotypha africana]